jgi:hypothetical protein
LLEREELVGDEIEVLMAELGEREPIEVPALRPDEGVVVVPEVVDGGRAGPGPSGDGNGQAPRRPDTPPLP